MHFGAKNAKWAQKGVKMEKGSSKYQRNHCLEQGLPKGAEMTQKSTQKRKNALLAPKNAFCAQNLQNTKKSIVYRGVGAMGAKLTLPKPKKHIFTNSRTFAPKTRFCAFFQF